MPRFARLALIAIAACGLTLGQDLTGRWSGTADTTDEAGTKRLEKQAFEFRMTDGQLAGIQISSSGKPGRALKVTQEGGKLNIYAFLDFEGGEHLRWKFELKDGKLVGTFSALHDSPKKWIYDRIGAMTLTAAKPD